MYIFLDTLWVEVTVESEVTMALAEQMAALPVPSGRLDDTVPQVIKFLISTFWCHYKIILFVF